MAEGNIAGALRRFVCCAAIIACHAATDHAMAEQDATLIQRLPPVDAGTVILTSGNSDRSGTGQAATNGGFEQTWYGSPAAHFDIQSESGPVSGYDLMPVETVDEIRGDATVTCDPLSAGFEFGAICGDRCSASPWWARGEVLLWFLDSYGVPPLVTTSPAGTPVAQAGVLGQPDTELLYGNQQVGGDLRLGGRMMVGRWFDPARHIGMQAEFFGLRAPDDGVYFESTGDPILARPFFNLDPTVGAQDAQIVALDGLATGSLGINTGGRIYSVAPTLRFNASCCIEDCKSRRWDVVLGYRYFHLGEDFSISETLRPAGGFFVPGTTYALSDAIETRNDFHGGEFGLEHFRQRNRWILELGVRAALGNLRRRFEARGQSDVLVPGVLESSSDGGFLVPVGLVTETSNKFAVLPQLRVGLGFMPRPNLRLHTSYDFLYLNRVSRPGSLMPQAIDGSGLLRGGGTTTLPAADSESVWLQGISFRATVNF